MLLGWKHCDHTVKIAKKVQRKCCDWKNRCQTVQVETHAQSMAFYCVHVKNRSISARIKFPVQLYSGTGLWVGKSYDA